MTQKLIFSCLLRKQPQNFTPQLDPLKGGLGLSPTRFSLTCCLSPHSYAHNTDILTAGYAQFNENRIIEKRNKL